MKIRLKIVLITSLAGVLLLIFTSLLANNIIISGFIKVEDSRMVQDVGRVNDALLEKMRSIDALNRDYATWDATYDAMMEKDSGYDNEDLAGVLSISRLDFAILMRDDGKIMYAKEMFSGDEKDYDVTTADPDARIVYSYFEKNYASIIIKDEAGDFNGLIQLPNGLAVISSRPILRTNGTGPIHGTIIIGQMMGESLVEKLSDQTHLFFSIQEYDSIPYETKLRLSTLFNDDNSTDTINNPFVSGHIIQDISESVASSNTSGAFVQVLPVNESIISGNVLLKGIFGRPVALLEVMEPRTIYLEGKNSVRYTIQAVLIVAILFIIIELLLLNKFIIARILSMEHQMKEIQSKKLAASRIIITDTDELSSLGESINAALDTIEKTTEEKQAVFDADPDTYFYVNSSWKIIDYKLTDTLDGIINEKKLAELKMTSKPLSLSDIFNSSIIGKLSKARSDSIKSLKPIILEFDMAVSGTLKVFESRVVTVNNNNKMSLILLRDITTRKRFEQQLLEKNKDLEKFNRFAIDRELRMSDMKKEMREMKNKKDMKKDTSKDAPGEE